MTFDDGNDYTAEVYGWSVDSICHGHNVGTGTHEANAMYRVRQRALFDLVVENFESVLEGT